MQDVPKNYAYGQEENNQFNELLQKYVPYWPLLLLMLVVSIAGAWFYLRYKVPIYQSSASILIKDENKGLNNSDVMEAFDMFSSKKIVENEIELIHSKTMAQEVVKALHLYAPVTEDGGITKRSAYLSSPIQVQVKNPDLITPIAKIAFGFNKQKGIVKIDGKEYSLHEWVATPYGDLQFTPNKYFTSTDKAKKFYFSLVPVKRAANDLVGRTKVSPNNKQSTVISIKIQDEIPQRGEDILNQLIATYNQAAIADKNSLASNTLAFVENRLKYVVHELDSVEGKLQQYKAYNKITDISAQGQVFLQTVGANDQKISDLSMQLAVLDGVEGYVTGKGGAGSIVPSTLGVSDPVLSGLLDKLYAAELEYEKLKKIAPENNPIIIALQDEMAKIKPNILENIRNQRRSLEAGRANLYSTNSQYSSMLQTIPAKERELLSISRQQGIKNNIYTFLLQKREEAALSYASTVADSRLVDKAETGEWPVSPRRSMIYLMAVALAFVLFIGVISLKEVLNSTIQYRAEIEKYTATPILGEVVHDATKNAIVIAEGKRTFIAEQFRHLRTSLGYLGINSRKKKILVTSTISGEGKSFITVNLGISLALMGKKVCLIELDLRKPKLSEALKVSRAVGISNYLIEQKEAEEIIKPTLFPNLFVIPSGPIPPNPSELILNGKIQELFTYLENAFDYVIVDTSPVSPVTDGYILSPLCDATLYIVRHGYTPRAFVQRLGGQNKINSLKNMAIVFNGIKQKGFGRYGAYGYGYGYGYTEEADKREKRKAKSSVSKDIIEG